MKFNFPFAWYNKFGTIPETYKEAMSYEEQILWLCKHQEELQTTITENYSELTSLIENAINELDETKQDKLIAGENIQIDGNIISSFNGEDLTSQLTLNSYFGDYNVGDTLPSEPTTFEDTASIVILEGASPVTYKIKGNYIVYEIDSSTREILEKDSATLTDGYGTFTTNGNRTLIVEFSATNTYEAKLIKLESEDETQCVITQLSEDVKLTSGSVSFSDGLYFTGSYKLINTDDSTIFPENTLFLYDSTESCLIGLSQTAISTQIGFDYWHFVSIKWIKSKFTLTSSIDSNSGIRDIPNAKGVYDTLNERIVVNPLTENIELNSSSVSLAEGVYNTGAFSVLKYDSDFQTYVAMIPHNTLFYYDESNNDFIMLYDDNVSGWLSEKWTYDSGTSDWVQTLNVISQTISSSSQATDIPSALAVYNSLAIKNLNDNITLTSSSVSLSTGLYYTGNYSLFYNLVTMFDNDTLFYYDSTNNYFIKLNNSTSSSDMISNYWVWNNSQWENTSIGIVTSISNASTHSNVPTAKSVYSFVASSLTPYIYNDPNNTNFVYGVWVGNETQYNQLTPSNTTLYFIEE